MLEGGYDLGALASATVATLEALSDEREPREAPSEPATAYRRPWLRLGGLLAVEEPRACVIIDIPASPITIRPIQAGKRRGDLAPIACANAGSHTETSAGSSSTML